jgi:hypothetical protein
VEVIVEHEVEEFINDPLINRCILLQAFVKKGRFSFIQLKKACNMLRGKGLVRTQDLEDTRQSALTTAPLARSRDSYIPRLVQDTVSWTLSYASMRWKTKQDGSLERVWPTKGKQHHWCRCGQTETIKFICPDW